MSFFKILMIIRPSTKYMTKPGLFEFLFITNQKQNQEKKKEKGSPKEEEEEEEKSMHGIKDTASEKLSRLFSASPSSQTLDQESEARPLAKDTKSLSSTLSSLPSGGFDWLRLNANSNGVKSVELLSFKWRSKSFSRKDESLDGYTECGHEYNKRANMPSHEENGDHGSTRSPNQNFKSSSSHLENGEPGSGRSTSSSSDIFKDASTPHSFGQSKPCLRDESFFISPELYQFLKSSLPNIVKGCQWVLLYSTVRHGISLLTLIRKSTRLSGHCLLIAGDMQGAVFGGLLDCPLNPTAKRKYQVR
ncbi:hypothetical protein Pfo_026500 [Paulownia fortunei]|nr:hypothetical protein Pfo_026500 [Paulownia fortunei]